MIIDNNKRAKLLINKITENGIYKLSVVQNNFVKYLVRLESRIRKLENFDK